MRQKKNHDMRNWFLGTLLAGGLVLVLAKTLNHKEEIQKPDLEAKVVQPVQEVNEANKADVVDVNKHNEDYIINYTANRVGVEPALLKAIRKAENGRRGFEFGILHTKAYENDKGVIEEGKFRPYKNDFEKQASWCAWTIKKNLERYGEWDNNFISFLHKQYAPIGVENDPSGLNKNWEKNVRFFYNKYKD